MRDVVWLGANTLTYPEGGGHFWAYLNWALGLKEAGCEVVWLETVESAMPEEELVRLLGALRDKLKRYGLHDSIALASRDGIELPEHLVHDLVPLAPAYDAALFLNMAYSHSAGLLDRFRRTALLDLDPGLLQVWIAEGVLQLPTHDSYFTIGENVGRADARFPSAGIKWTYTPPCVATSYWPVLPARCDAPFTTVSHWSANEWVSFRGGVFANDKRTGFSPYLTLPRRTRWAMELALCLGMDAHSQLDPAEAEECDRLTSYGWRVVHAHAVSATPWDYQRYIQGSRAEFSCAKPAYVRLQPGWISDRTLCYLASGRPAVVQHTGASCFLPENNGFFRFRDLPEAIRALELLAGDYEHHCRQARHLAEEFFSAGKVVPRLLDRALAKRAGTYFLPNSTAEKAA